jgi:hypothetical protein
MLENGRDSHASVFASERLAGALLDRFTHHVHILEMNGDSYGLKQSKQRLCAARSAHPTLTKRHEKAPAGAFSCLSLMYFYSGQLMQFYSGVDTPR